MPSTLNRELRHESRPGSIRSIRASFGNAVLLLVALGSVAWEAAHRLRRLVTIDSTGGDRRRGDRAAVVTALVVHGAPQGIDLAKIRAALLVLSGVRDLHALHIWGMASLQTALTAHLVLEAEHDDQDSLLLAATLLLQERLKIRHVTLQLEFADCPRDDRC